MPAKKGFSERAWDEIINADAAGAWIDGAMLAAEERPADPFADTGPLLDAMLRRGVTRDQLCRLARAIRVAGADRLAEQLLVPPAQLRGRHSRQGG